MNRFNACLILMVVFCGCTKSKEDVGDIGVTNDVFFGTVVSSKPIEGTKLFNVTVTYRGKNDHRVAISDTTEVEGAHIMVGLLKQSKQDGSLHIVLHEPLALMPADKSKDVLHIMTGNACAKGTK